MLVYGATDQVVRWVLAHINIPFAIASPGATAIGAVNEKGQLIGGCIYSDYRRVDITVSAAGQDGWMTPGNIRGFCRYPFIQLGCRRVTSVVPRKFKKARAFNEKFGFKLEGISRKALEDGQDAFIFGMLREECKWLKDEYEIRPAVPFIVANTGPMMANSGRH